VLQTYHIVDMVLKFYEVDDQLVAFAPVRSSNCAVELYGPNHACSSSSTIRPAENVVASLYGPEPQHCFENRTKVSQNVVTDYYDSEHYGKLVVANDSEDKIWTTSQRVNPQKIVNIDQNLLTTIQTLFQIQIWARRNNSSMNLSHPRRQNVKSSILFEADGLDCDDMEDFDDQGREYRLVQWFRLIVSFVRNGFIGLGVSFMYNGFFGRQGIFGKEGWFRQRDWFGKQMLVGKLLWEALYEQIPIIYHRVNSRW